MQDKVKSEHTLTALLPSPVVVGNRAMLFTDTDMIQTSVVTAILRQTTGGIRFETNNSIYNVCYDKRQASLAH